jgi:DNA modification methylase
MIIVGDSLTSLKGLEDNSVQMCVTSPPYWGLRDYGTEKQLGTEPMPEDYIKNMVEIFREVKRVLKKDGTLWLNIGDTFFGGGRDRGNTKPLTAKQTSNNGANNLVSRHFEWPKHDILKPKDLVGIPWRVALALQADGWYLRQDIVWYKPNCFPESVKDRCTKSHEYIFLLSKSSSYYFDSNAIREPAVRGAAGSKFNTGKTAIHQQSRSSDKPRVETGFRNKRSVWQVNTKPFKGAHFATFPPELIEPCILAGSMPGAIVLDPFFGSGTTGFVAAKHGRGFVGIEINPEYAEIARARVAVTNRRSELSLEGKT